MRLAKADRAHTRQETRLAGAVARIDALDAEVADHPDPRVIAEQLAAVTELEDALRRARLAAKRARAEAAAAREHIAAVEATEARERRRFDETRDALGRLGPPVPARDRPRRGLACARRVGGRGAAASRRVRRRRRRPRRGG